MNRAERVVWFVTGFLLTVAGVADTALSRNAPARLMVASIVLGLGVGILAVCSILKNR